MKITIHCEGTKEEIATQLKEALEVYGEETSNISIAEIKAKRGKGKGKGKKDEPEEEEAVDPDDEVEETEEEETEEEFTEEEETEEEESDTVSESDLKKLKSALNAHSGKNGKKKTVAILQKFAAKSDEVKTSDLPKLLKLLKV